MSVNLDLIKKKLQDIESSSKKSAYLWKPKAGETTIRIVPYQHNTEFPFIEMYFHYNIGKKSFVSLKTYGEEDPIEEFALELQKTGDTDDYKLGKKLLPALRTYAPIIIRGEESKGVIFWGFGKEVYAELLKTMNDPDYGDITDFKTGRDIVVEYKTPQEAGNTYGKISIRIKPNASPVTRDEAILNIVKNGQPRIEAVYPKNTYEELSAALKKWLEPTSEEDSNDQPEADDVLKKETSNTATPKGSIPTKSQSTSTPPKSTNKESVLNDFSTMMEDDDLPF